MMFSQGAGLRFIIIALGFLIFIQTVAVGLSSYVQARDLGTPVPALLIRQVAAAAELMDDVPAENRQTALRAINSPFVRYRLIGDFADADLPGEPLQKAYPIIRGFIKALEDRPLQFHIRSRGWRAPFRIGRQAGTLFSDEIFIVIGLKNGGALVVEPNPDYRRQLVANFAAFLSSIVGVGLLAGLVWASLGATRPIRRMASAAEVLASNLDAPPIEETGPEPVRNLARSFNAMQRDLKAMIEQRTIALAAVAHDYRTYLTRLRMRAEYIADDAQREKAHADIEDMTQLIDTTLLYAKSHRSSLALRPVDLCGLAADIVDEQTELGRAVVLASAPAAALALADRAAAKRAVVNVVENAVRYGKQATIFIEADDETVNLTVADRGPGAAIDDLDRLTEPFFRIETSRSRQTGGAGLGLAITKMLMTSLGGAIGLENAPEGGLRVRLTFQRAKGAPPRPSVA